MFDDVAEAVWALGVLTIMPSLLTAASNYDGVSRLYEATGTVWVVRVLGITPSLLSATKLPLVR